MEIKRNQDLRLSVESIDIEDLLSAVYDEGYSNRECLVAFLERCQDETIVDAGEALGLLFEAPEYVRRVEDVLEAWPTDCGIKKVTIISVQGEILVTAIAYDPFPTSKFYKRRKS